MRVQARKPASYYTRAIWGLIAGGFIAVVVLLNPGIVRNGSYLFAMMHGALAVIFLVSPPLVCADAISRERRDGTLGLLLLTPLTARQIVISKLFIHFWRLFYLWLMMVPFLMMPVLVGGLTLQDFLVSNLILLAIIITGVAAGFLSSALSLSFGSAVMRSILVAAILNLLLSALATNVPFLLSETRQQNYVPAIVRVLLFGPYYIIAPSLIGSFFQGMFSIRNVFQVMVAGHAAASFLLLLFAISFATWRVSHLAESTASSRRKETFRRRFLTPIIFKNRFQKSMRRTLDRNPFRWLEYRTPTARIGIWIATAGLLVIEIYTLSQDYGAQSIFNVQLPFLVLLLLTIALKSAASFQYEKENAAFELILVTTVTEKTLVRQRLRAVRRYYLPLIVTLAAFTLFGLYWRNFQPPFYNIGTTVNFVSYWTSLISVPAAGLFFALRFKTYIPALSWTIALSIFGIPFLFTCLKTFLWYGQYRLNYRWTAGLNDLIDDARWPVVVAVILSHIVLTIAFAKMSASLLQRRSFADAKN